MIKLIFSYLPIVFLIYLMTRKKSMPSYKALPLSALAAYLIVLIIFRFDPTLIHATIIEGLIIAWTPILIIAGAIFLFKTMEATGGLTIIKKWLNHVSDNKIAQLMIVGWAFPFLIEGASGFGTPAAIAAPILVGLGFPPVRIAILALIMNSIPVSFGAVGTPTWFGFGKLSLLPSEIMDIGFKSALLNSVAALFIPAIALLFVVKPKTVIKNFLFIVTSVLITVIPYLIIAKFSYEFPSLIGGAIGLTGTILIAKTGFGLSKSPVEMHETIGISNLVKSDLPNEQLPGTINANHLIKAAFPLWGTILLLIVTRIPEIGLMDLLRSRDPELELALGSFGAVSFSPSLVITFKNIFGTGINRSHELLYIPSLIPFAFISVIAFLWTGNAGIMIKRTFSETVSQMKNPTLALLGALVFVQLMMMSSESIPSATTNIGTHLADLTGNSWKYFSALLGALGSFFSGSNTISNLTFGEIQDSIAKTSDLNRTTILAMQSVGGAMGNMVCINNIVAVASVLALGKQEGYILKRTFRAMLAYALIVGLMAVFFQ